MLKKLLILSSSILVWQFTFIYFKPWLVSFYSPYIKNLEPGLKLFLRHAFVFSTPTALACSVWFYILAKLKYTESIHFLFDKQALTKGLYLGLIISLVTVVCSPVLGLQLKPHFNVWSLTGNIVSNFCEELIFRGLLLYSILQLTNSKQISALLSGIIFGLTHEQYDWLGKIYISILGYLLGVLTTQNNNLIPAYTAHNVADWILDCIY